MAARAGGGKAARERARRYGMSPAAARRHERKAALLAA